VRWCASRLNQREQSGDRAGYRGDTHAAAGRAHLPVQDAKSLETRAVYEGDPRQIQQDRPACGIGQRGHLQEQVLLGGHVYLAAHGDHGRGAVAFAHEHVHVGLASSDADAPGTLTGRPAPFAPTAFPWHTLRRESRRQGPERHELALSVPYLALRPHDTPAACAAIAFVRADAVSRALDGGPAPHRTGSKPRLLTPGRAAAIIIHTQ
jgi:hypothetical protein